MLNRGDQVIFRPAFGEEVWAYLEGQKAEVLAVEEDNVSIVFEDGTELDVVDFEVEKV